MSPKNHKCWNSGNHLHAGSYKSHLPVNGQWKKKKPDDCQRMVKKKTKKVDDFNYDSSMLFSLLIQQQVVFWWKRNPRILKKKKKIKSDKHTTESYAVKGAGTALRRLKKNIIPHLRYSSHSVELKHRLLTTSPNNPLFFLCSFILKV